MIFKVIDFRSIVNASTYVVNITKEKSNCFDFDRAMEYMGNHLISEEKYKS